MGKMRGLGGPFPIPAREFFGIRSSTGIAPMWDNGGRPPDGRPWWPPPPPWRRFLLMQATEMAAIRPPMKIMQDNVSTAISPARK